MSERARKAKLYWRKWKWYERNSMPWRRLDYHREMLRRECFVRWPIHGNMLWALRTGRMELGRGVHFDHDVWIDVLMSGHLKLGDRVALNVGVFVSCFNEVEIGDHTGVGNGSFISDGMRGFNPASTTPFMRQPMETKGPTRIGKNCWIGVNSIITSGVTIGDWCIVGANSVVTKDVPSYSVVGGVPARVLRQLDPATAEAAVGARAAAGPGSPE
jgi:acetyltransferase-like isoleucine patch superfamily enzyme